MRLEEKGRESKSEREGKRYILEKIYEGNKQREKERKRKKKRERSVARYTLSKSCKKKKISMTYETRLIIFDLPSIRIRAGVCLSTSLAILNGG